jgi:hypothetical protein
VVTKAGLTNYLLALYEELGGRRKKIMRSTHFMFKVEENVFGD